MSCYKHRLILHRSSVLGGSGQDKTGASLLDRAERAELLFSCSEHLLIQFPLKDGQSCPCPRQSSPAPHSPNPHHPQQFLFLQAKEAAAASCGVFAVPVRLLPSAAASFAHVLNHLKEGESFHMVWWILFWAELELWNPYNALEMTPPCMRNIAYMSIYKLGFQIKCIYPHSVTHGKVFLPLKLCMETCLSILNALDRSSFSIFRDKHSPPSSRNITNI